MQTITRFVGRLAVVSLVAFQLSCGGDPSGPGNVATTMSANSATTISSPPGSQVSERPSVVVYDQTGDPLSGVTVTFLPASGGGSVTGESQVTNAEGVATVGSWTLGSVPGTNTLTATVSGLPPLVFTASSINPCTVAVAHTLGGTSQGTLGSGDCQFGDGTYADFYRTSLTAGTYVFDQASSSFDTFLFLSTEPGAPVGVNDDYGGTNSRIKAIVPAGSYILEAGAYSTQSGTTGAYTLSSASTTAEVTNCEDVFVMKGISTTQSLQTADCSRGGVYSDEYYIFVAEGQSLTITMTSSAVNSFLTVLSQSGTMLASNDNRGDGSNDARVAFIATAANFYIIRAGSAVTGATGQYTLVIE